MFSEAIARAGKFTIPVVISSRTVAGKCRCEIGAGVVVNRDGWVLTAAHVLALIRSQQESVQAFRARPAAAPDTAPRGGWLARRRGRKRTAEKETPAPDVVRDHSVWWGSDGAVLHEVTLDAANDLAVGRLQPFDPQQIPCYPVFKRPDGDYRPGRSLCRLGFSFHDIVPTYDEARQAFLLPADSVPLPLFPFEGMLVRMLRCPSPTAENGGAGHLHRDLDSGPARPERRSDRRRQRYDLGAAVVHPPLSAGFQAAAAPVPQRRGRGPRRADPAPARPPGPGVPPRPLKQPASARPARDRNPGSDCSAHLLLEQFRVVGIGLGSAGEREAQAPVARHKARRCRKDTIVRPPVNAASLSKTQDFGKSSARWKPACVCSIGATASPVTICAGGDGDAERTLGL